MHLKDKLVHNMITVVGAAIFSFFLLLTASYTSLDQEEQRFPAAQTVGTDRKYIS